MQLDLIAEAITEYWGERCPDFDADCPCCKAWKQFDALSTLQGAEQKPVAWQRRKGTSNRHHPDQWEWTAWESGRWSPGHKDKPYARFEERPLFAAPVALHDKIGGR